MRLILTAAALLLLLMGMGARAQTPFASGGATVSLAATTTSGAVQIQTGVYASSLRVFNSGTVTVFLLCGGAAAVATAATGVPVPGGVVEVLSCPATHVAGLAASGTATVYLTPGTGL